MTRERTVAARVPQDLRDDLEKIAARDNADLSVVVRRLLRAGADRELEAGGPERLGLFGDTLAGTARRRPTATELEAKLKVAPRVGTARFKALAAFELAGGRGLTADEVCAKLEPAPVNGTARRVTDLLQGELIAAARLFDERPLVAGERVMDDGNIARLTRNQAWAQVYVITSAGHRALEDARVKQRQEAAA